ncbi:Polyphenol oxidase 1 [Rhizophlyctis rosea]|uniref:Polyphenol oxidase 1 n=1 Tax=Rhizophlyctis rosea TaxID=64517 RepID=A0AAD5X990_9FUNG|nr:Polyphenol oxidase 1 [Rhizophlyctis rosea]
MAAGAVDVQSRVDKFLSVPTDFRHGSSAVNPAGFSIFDPEQMVAVTKMEQRLMQVAADSDNNLSAVVDEAEELAKSNDPEAVRHALMVFITHHPAAQRQNIRIRPLKVRAPVVSTPRPTKPAFHLPADMIPPPNPKFSSGANVSVQKRRQPDGTVVETKTTVETKQDGTVVMTVETKETHPNGSVRTTKRTSTRTPGRVTVGGRLQQQQLPQPPRPQTQQPQQQQPHQEKPQQHQPALQVQGESQGGAMGFLQSTLQSLGITSQNQTKPQQPPPQKPAVQQPPRPQQGQTPIGQTQPPAQPPAAPQKPAAAPAPQQGQTPIGQAPPPSSDIAVPEDAPDAGKTIAQVFQEEGRDPEEALDYWREDQNLNEHHEHWHIVYPNGGVPNPANPSQLRIKDRQGELFVYMHQQMIARYNAERSAVGLPNAVPILNYREPIVQGDAADDDLRFNGQFTFTPRPPNAVISDLGRKGERGYTPVAQLEQWRDALLKVIENGRFPDGSPVTPDTLGSSLEANAGGKSPEVLGSLHNMGHVFIAYIANPADYRNANNIPGLMYETRTAVRDPVFWRWHSGIDELFFRWQERQPPNNFSDAPPVAFRKQITQQFHASPDIILAFADKLRAAGANTKDPKAVEQWAQTNFGGANWEQNFAAKTTVTTDELYTAIRKRDMHWAEDSGQTEEVSYIYPRDFWYFFRLENKGAAAADVTLRVFIVPTEQAENRRAYIEMDKFKVTIPANGRHVVARPADLSSVIRKPAQKNEDEMDDRTDSQLGGRGDAYCDCGWPFNMLVPRGNPQGQPFRIVVLATDWNKDQVPNREGCGSMSFCGAKDKYPDSREMGYPFNRRFEGSIADAVAKNAAWASRDIHIKWVATVPDAE